MKDKLGNEDQVDHCLKGPEFEFHSFDDFRQLSSKKNGKKLENFANVSYIPILSSEHKVSK